MTTLARLCRIVALWWRSRRWVECSECGVVLTADEKAEARRSLSRYCEDCRELAPKPLWRDPSQWRPGMVIPLPPRRPMLVYTLHDYRTTHIVVDD